MSDIPGHFLPSYTDATRDDALFHYTTATGLIGIFRDMDIWSTSYHCANDESELAAGTGILQPLFRTETLKMIDAEDSRMRIFRSRGVNAMEYADKFEDTVVSLALSSLSAFMTCFCRANAEEDFHHGLLSQWRGYGVDGGYALHFSRKKLMGAIERSNRGDGVNYDLQDVYYTPENLLKNNVLQHGDAFVRAYVEFLDRLAQPLGSHTGTMPSPLAPLVGGPLEAYLDYLTHTKNKHFGEERECRLSLLQPISPTIGGLPVHYFNRGGLPVPYTKTPAQFSILECLEWIVIGPGPRMGARFKSVAHLVKQSGFAIKLRASHIPFTRL